MKPVFGMEITGKPIVDYPDVVLYPQNLDTVDLSPS